jgi:hypothetical protein
MNDSRGLSFSSGTSSSHETYEHALAALNVYRGDAVAIIEEALITDPDFVMGHVLRAEVLITMWERSVLGREAGGMNTNPCCRRQRGLNYNDFTKTHDERRRERFRMRNHRWRDAPRYSAAWLSYHLLW